MKASITHVVVFVCTVSPVLLQEPFSISDSLNAFTIDLLAATNNEAGDHMNLALSPYTVWTLMTIVCEGARENTANQLNTMLRLPRNKESVRNSFQNLSRILEQKSDKSWLQLSNGMFTSSQFPVKDKFSDLAKNIYNVNINSVSFENSLEAADIINKYIAKATKNRIMRLINQEDIKNAYLFLASTLYFKGEWKTPFNRSATHQDVFYDEKKNKLGQVNMMYQMGVFPYFRSNELKSEILELPYGFDDKVSMIIVLPRSGQSLANVLNSMTRQKFSDLLSNLKTAAYEYSDDDIHVYLPKFKITSDFNLDRILDKLGAKDVFNIHRANLLGMFPHYLYLSRVIQRAEIEVDEEGTVAAAASGAAFPNKSPPPIFRANRPFLYFIVDKMAESVVFAGKVSEPIALQ